MIEVSPDTMNKEIGIAEKIYEHTKKRIRRLPNYTNRASMLGYFVPELDGCLRRGVYERARWAEKELINPKVQLIFDEGNNQEKSVLKLLSEVDVDIIEQQTAFEWPEYQITGHIDGTYIYEGVPIPIEIKSMHPNIFIQMNSFQDFDKKPWTKSYKAQINLYMLFKNVNRALYILKNKSTGEIKTLVIELDYELSEWCLKAAEKINEHIKNKTVPGRITDREKCKSCPFKLICCPDINFGEPLQIVDDPDFEKRLISYNEIETLSKEAKSTYEIIKERCKETAAKSKNKELNLICGQFSLTGKFDRRGAFRMKIERV